MIRVVTVLTIILVLAVAGGAWAASPSLLGPTGLLLIPTADTLGMASFDIGATAFMNEGPDSNAFYGNVGIFSGLEIGATLIHPDEGDNETIFNAKFQLPQPIPVDFSWAVGAIDVTDEIDFSPYIVFSHTIGGGYIPVSGIPRIHLGLGGGTLDGLFGGISFDYSNTTFIAEYDGENFNLGAKFPIFTKLELSAAALDSFDDFAVGLSFSSPW